MTAETISVPPPLPASVTGARRSTSTIKLLLIAVLVLVLQIPLYLVNSLRQERSDNRKRAFNLAVTAPTTSRVGERAPPAPRVEESPADSTFDSYRMVERSLKHGVLVLALVFTAFFLFEMLAGLRLHVIHYGLVGAALCLFYLALLALGEITAPESAYVGAALASSLLITLYSAAILRAWARAGLIAGLLAAVHSVLFVVLRMEDFALLAGTAALFAALASVMYFTRNVDWFAQDAAAAPARAR